MSFEVEFDQKRSNGYIIWKHFRLKSSVLPVAVSVPLRSFAKKVVSFVGEGGPNHFPLLE